MILHRGVAYYPEFWPEERWDEDVRLMKEAGINLARIGEFAWTAMEPAEGQLDLGWLHRIVEKLGDAGINVLLCTPTATPPAWLTKTYPDTLLVRKDGARARHGSRRHYCPTSPTYRRHSARITEALATEFARHENVIAYQLDNEFGPEMSFCFCQHCTGLFRAWLRERYGSLEGVNRAWQTRFWSITYTDWQEIELLNGGNYPSIELDIQRFHSDSFVDFAAHQTGIIRAHHPSALVTTNMMGPIFTPLDYYKMAELFDFVADDLYFDIATMSADAAAMDIFRAMKPGKPFWITETGSAALSEGKGPYPDQIRAWAYSALAHGSEAHVFFRWRTCLAGQEQDLQGVIETSGKPRRRYKAVQDLFTELESLKEKLGAAPPPQPQVAILSSYDCHWAYESARIGKQVGSVVHLLSLHELCFDRNVPVDVIPPDRDFAPYRLLILPSLCIVPEDLAARLKSFVENGGVVLATPQLSTRDANNNYVPRCAPDGLHHLFGLRVESHYYLENFNEADEALWVPAAKSNLETVKVELEDGISGVAERYVEDIDLHGARVMASFADNIFAGQPAITSHTYGSGETFYTAGYLDSTLMAALLEKALHRALVPLGPKTPKWVEVIRCGDVTFAINHSRETATIPMPTGEIILGDWSNGMAKLAPYGVCVVRE